MTARVFSLWSNSIHCGDPLDLLPYVGANTVALTIYSPPYDEIRDYAGGWTFDRRELGRQLFRVTVDGGVCAVVIGDGAKKFAKSLTTFRWVSDWAELGWKLFECCIYHRHGKPDPSRSRRFRVDHESILIFFKGERPRHFNKSSLMVPKKHPERIFAGTDRLTSGKFRRVKLAVVARENCRGEVGPHAASTTKKNKTKLEHPPTYPDRLAADLIRCFLQRKDLVLDPMCGGGTTPVVAAKHGRFFLGIDSNERYCGITRRRLKDEAGIAIAAPLEPEWRF